MRALPLLASLNLFACASATPDVLPSDTATPPEFVQFGDELLMHVITEGSQENPAAAFRNDQWVMVFEEKSDGEQIASRPLDAWGQGPVEELLAAPIATHPVISTYGQGYWSAWQDEEGLVGGPLDETGVWSGEEVVIALRDSDHVPRYPDMAVRGSEILVAWQVYGASARYAWRVIDADGVGPVQELPSKDALGAGPPALVAWGDGYLLAYSWVFDDGSSLYLQELSGSGELTGPPVEVASGGVNYSRPRLVTSDWGLAVAWRDHLDEVGLGAWVRLSDDPSAFPLPAILLSEIGNRVDLVALSGRIFATWEEADGDVLRLYGATLHPDGDWEWGPQALTSADEYARRPTPVASPTGDASWLLWERQGALGRDIIGRPFTVLGDPLSQ